MEYTILNINDNGTAKVSMDVDGHILEQDFDLGETPEELTANIEKGMAILHVELGRKAETVNASDQYQDLVGVTKQVRKLPVLEQADFEVERPADGGESVKELSELR